MKLISYIHNGNASYGIQIGDGICDLRRRWGGKFATLRLAIAGGAFVDLEKVSGAASIDFPFSEIVLNPPITDPEKIVCIGLNYHAHAAEGGFKVPKQPSVFLRLTNTLVASGQPLIRPLASTDFDYEGELAIVIGKGGWNIKESSALDHVFGYSCFNDGSIRDFQFNHCVSVGKNFPSTGGFGPCVVTRDEIQDPSKLMLVTRVNGKQVQGRGTSDMIFDVQKIIAYVSSWTELSPGDVIATGTPEGVGFARKPPLWLKAGDLVEVDISQIGVLSNSIKDGH